MGAGNGSWSQWGWRCCAGPATVRSRQFRSRRHRRLSPRNPRPCIPPRPCPRRLLPRPILAEPSCSLVESSSSPYCDRRCCWPPGMRCGVPIRTRFALGSATVRLGLLKACAWTRLPDGWSHWNCTTTGWQASFRRNWGSSNNCEAWSLSYNQLTGAIPPELDQHLSLLRYSSLGINSLDVFPRPWLVAASVLTCPRARSPRAGFGSLPLVRAGQLQGGGPFAQVTAGPLRLSVAPARDTVTGANAVSGSCGNLFPRNSEFGGAVVSGIFPAEATACPDHEDGGLHHWTATRSRNQEPWVSDRRHRMVNLGTIFGGQHPGSRFPGGRLLQVDGMPRRRSLSPGHRQARGSAPSRVARGFTSPDREHMVTSQP